VKDLISICYCYGRVSAVVDGSPCIYLALFSVEWPKLAKLVSRVMLQTMLWFLSIELWRSIVSNAWREHNALQRLAKDCTSHLFYFLNVFTWADHPSPPAILVQRNSATVHHIVEICVWPPMLAIIVPVPVAPVLVSGNSSGCKFAFLHAFETFNSKLR
jgi:hypothetical protein